MYQLLLIAIVFDRQTKQYVILYNDLFNKEKRIVLINV